MIPDQFMVSWAMRYGQPSIPDRLNELKQAGCNRLLIVPLYPQYAAATTATVQDEVFEWMIKQRWQPAVRTVAPWHDHPFISKSWQKAFGRPPKAISRIFCLRLFMAYRNGILCKVTPIIASVLKPRDCYAMS
jgi:protoheme ferro-lyase